jgi:hypothetical protein
MKMNFITPLLGLLAIAMVCLYASCTKDYGDPTTRNHPISGASHLTYGASTPDCHPDASGCTTSGASTVTAR